jgi:hypothetical protein
MQMKKIKKNKLKMNKKGISFVLIDLFSAIAIILVIGIFFFVFKFKVDKMEADITGSVYGKTLEDVFIAYLKMPVNYNGVNMTNSDMIVQLAEEDKLGDLDTGYFTGLYSRTSYRVESIAVYRQGEQLRRWNMAYPGDVTGEAVFGDMPEADRIQTAWVLLPGKDGSMYYLRVLGYVG